ncbi:MAG: IS4 family transposase [bacterium]|nr:IS4 family transposase [bacterium]
MNFTTSLFSQILHVVPRNSFLRLVHQRGAERHAKGFSSWTQYVAMLFCQLAQAKSLREISDGLAVTCGKLTHLGLSSAPAKSTLAYANAHRPWQLYQDTFFQLLDVCRKESPGKKRKFRFKNKLFSIDSTTIDLCLSLFPWADFRQTKGAVKLHMLLDHDGYLPNFAVITDGKGADVIIARHFTLPFGSIVAVDRGYIDFDLFFQWNKSGVFFVTRLKDNAAYEVIENRPLPQRGNVLVDQIIRFTVPQTRLKYPGLLRRVVVWDEENKREIELLTNHLRFGATTIGQIYRDRWEIELFFKVLKQHLKIKTFVGTSPNALKTQIWTALIAVLLLRYLQFRSKYNLPLCRLVALLRLNLFSYRDLWDWLDDPFETPPELPNSQLELAF